MILIISNRSISRCIKNLSTIVNLAKSKISDLIKSKKSKSTKTKKSDLSKTNFVRVNFSGIDFLILKIKHTFIHL